MLPLPEQPGGGPKFQKGKEYDAYYDRVLDACYLDIDQGPGGVAGRAYVSFIGSTLLAAVAIAVIVMSKRRGWNRNTPPGGAGAVKPDGKAV